MRLHAPAITAARLRWSIGPSRRVLEEAVFSPVKRVDIREKIKTKDSAIPSAFLKGNTREHLLLFYLDQRIEAAVPSDELVKIKFEIDTNPPAGARFERKYRLLPAPYEIRLYDAPSLFAAKVHAVLCRGWKNRVKGRDLYDYVFYRSQQTPLNLEHLNMRLRRSGFFARRRRAQWARAAGCTALEVCGHRLRRRGSRCGAVHRGRRPAAPLERGLLQADYRGARGAVDPCRCAGPDLGESPGDFEKFEFPSTGTTGRKKLYGRDEGIELVRVGA